MLLLFSLSTILYCPGPIKTSKFSLKTSRLVRLAAKLVPLFLPSCNCGLYEPGPTSIGWMSRLGIETAVLYMSIGFVADRSGLDLWTWLIDRLYEPGPGVIGFISARRTALEPNAEEQRCL